MTTMYVAAVLDRTRSGIVALLIAVSLLASALPASAGSFASRGFDSGWDFLDPTNITWERVKPRNITWESITWE
jgi:hypothetical protein